MPTFVLSGLVAVILFKFLSYMNVLVTGSSRNRLE
jgi:hypothetical protein